MQNIYGKAAAFESEAVAKALRQRLVRNAPRRRSGSQKTGGLI
jgi:hypothetical protein